LKAFKIDSDENQKLINIKDRGGLWTVSTCVCEIFFEFEVLFRQKTQVWSNSFDRSNFITDIMANGKVIRNFNVSCLSADMEVEKEFRMNLLEHMINLFINVRMFSHAKDIKEKHKIIKKDSRKRSLRTEMKLPKEDSNING